MITRFLASIFLASTLLFAPVTVSAQIDPFADCASGVVTQSDICNAAAGGGALFGPGSLWNRILNTLTFVIGAISVLMMVIGAIRYSLSAGDSNNINGAKNTIIYAAVALIVAVMANAIVNFVLTNI